MQHSIPRLIFSGACASTVASLVAIFIVRRLFGLQFHGLLAEFCIAAVNGIIQGSVLPLFLMTGFFGGFVAGLLLTSFIYWLAHRTDWSFLDAIKFAGVQSVTLLLVSFFCLALGIR